MGDACSTVPKKKMSPTEKKALMDKRIQEAIKRSLSETDGDPTAEQNTIFKGEFGNKKHELGTIRAVGVAKQFDNPVVERLSEKHQTCKATCGYFCTAVARILASKDPNTLTAANINTILEDELLNIETLKPFLDEAMSFTMKDRFSYCDSVADNLSDKDRAAYLRDWVANYEISDFLQQLEPLSTPIAFLRHNQTVDLPEAKHVERDQIIREEVPFGEEPPFLIELFHPRRLFVSSKDDFLKECESRSINPKEIVWIMDLNGHFDVALTPSLIDETDILYFDSLKSSCCENTASQALLELL